MEKFLLPSFLFLSVSLQAQNFLSWKFNDRYFSAFVGTGASTYFGELNFDNKINDRLSQLNTGIEARLLSRLSARIEATYFVIEGSDGNAPDSSFQRQRNLSFKSRNIEFQLNGIYYIKRYRGDYYKRWVFDPYIFCGIGYMFYNPTASLGNETFSLRKAQTEGLVYKKWALTVPAGMGAKFKVNEFLNFNIEFSYHFTFTDYLDDVSATYATEFPNTTAELLSDRKDEISVVNPAFYDQIVPGSRRGDTSKKDGFMLVSIKAEIFLPPGLFSSKNQPFIKKSSAYQFVR